MGHFTAVVLDDGILDIIKAAGRTDAIRGVDVFKGWEEMRDACGLSAEHPSAKRAYEAGYDGFYNPPPTKPVVHVKDRSMEASK